jgi:hypothetical protein
MKNQSRIKFRLPKGLLYALLSFFIFSAVPSSGAERTSIRTEQLVEARGSQSHISSAKFYSPVRKVAGFSKTNFLSALLSYSCSVEVRLENQDVQVLNFSPNNITQILYPLLYTDEEYSTSHLG